jgi:hypothetical protein
MYVYLLLQRFTYRPTYSYYLLRKQSDEIKYQNFWQTDSPIQERFASSYLLLERDFDTYHCTFWNI